MRARGEIVILRRGEDFRPRKWPVVHASLGLIDLVYMHKIVVSLRPFATLGITPVLKSRLFCREDTPPRNTCTRDVSMTMIIILG